MANRKLTITFMHPGAPSVARLASLAGEGWLQVATDGWLNIVTPQLVEADAGAQFGRIRLRDINFLLIGSVFTDLADELYTSPVGWAILPTTLTATFAALEATGELSWQPAATVEEAFDKLQAAANSLSHADRELEVGDLAFYPVVLPAAPDFTDFITPRMLGCARGGALVNLRLYLQLLGAGSNTPDERTQPGSLFSDSKTSLVASASAWLKRADAAPSMRQKAADVAMFLGFSHPQHDKFLLHVPADDIFSELTRRGRPTAAEQLEPHFDAAWGAVWPVLAWAFPQASTGRTARRFLAQICASAEYTMIAGLSLELINSICNDIDKIKEEGRLDNDTFRHADDALRCTMLGVSLLALKSSRKTTSTTTTAADNDQDVRSKLMKSAGFKELMQAVDSCSKDDFSAIATAMMRADHAGGLAYIAGKPIFTFGDFAAVRGNQVLDDILKTAISLDFSGRYRPEWDTIASGAMKKFVMGDWSAETIFALHFSKYIAMRDGKRIITEHKDEFASGRW